MQGRKDYIAVAVLAIWLVATGLAFWWLEFRSLRMFAEENGARALSDAQVVAQLEAAATMLMEHEPAGARLATLVHFSEPDCECSKASTTHLRDLWTRYGAQGLEVIVAEPRSGPVVLEGFGTAVQVHQLGAVWELVTTVPAAALFGADGRLIYFGPYSSGPSCGQGISFIDNVLEKLQSGVATAWINDLAFGCFCDPHSYRS